MVSSLSTNYSQVLLLFVNQVMSRRQFVILRMHCESVDWLNIVSDDLLAFSSRFISHYLPKNVRVERDFGDHIHVKLCWKIIWICADCHFYHCEITSKSYELECAEYDLPPPQTNLILETNLWRNGTFIYDFQVTTPSHKHKKKTKRGGGCFCPNTLYAYKKSDVGSHLWMRLV